MRKKDEKLKNDGNDEIVVFWIVKETECAECGAALGKACFLRLEGEKALCMECADLDHLEFLPRGDTALTRRAGKYSNLRAVVVRWSPNMPAASTAAALAAPLLPRNSTKPRSDWLSSRTSGMSTPITTSYWRGPTIERRRGQESDQKYRPSSTTGRIRHAVPARGDAGFSRHGGMDAFRVILARWLGRRPMLPA
jgi:hypothetical protein